MFIHATPPVAQLALPAHASVRAPMQVDPDTATLTAQPYLRLIRWVGVNSPINVPKVAVLDTRPAADAANSSTLNGGGIHLSPSPKAMKTA
jgi:hypothetical protein